MEEAIEWAKRCPDRTLDSASLRFARYSRRVFRPRAHRRLAATGRTPPSRNEGTEPRRSAAAVEEFWASSAEVVRSDAPATAGTRLGTAAPPRLGRNEWNICPNATSASGLRDRQRTQHQVLNFAVENAADAGRQRATERPTAVGFVAPARTRTAYTKSRHRSNTYRFTVHLLAVITRSVSSGWALAGSQIENSPFLHLRKTRCDGLTPMSGFRHSLSTPGPGEPVAMKRLENADRVVDRKRPPVGDPRRTTRPHHMDGAEPLLELRDKPTFSGILHQSRSGGQRRRDRRSGSTPGPSRRSSGTSTT